PAATGVRTRAQMIFINPSGPASTGSASTALFARMPPKCAPASADVAIQPHARWHERSGPARMIERACQPKGLRKQHEQTDRCPDRWPVRHRCFRAIAGSGSRVGSGYCLEEHVGTGCRVEGRSAQEGSQVAQESREEGCEESGGRFGSRFELSFSSPGATRTTLYRRCDGTQRQVAARRSAFCLTAPINDSRNLRESRYEESAVVVPVRSALPLSPLLHLPSPHADSAPQHPRAWPARLAAALLAGATLALSACDALAQPLPATLKRPNQFPRAQLTIGMYVVDAAIAANPAEREQGLMFRKSLAPNEGMLFVFNENAVHCFWMKNTSLPLSIAFIRADGTITDLDEMQAETQNNHCPAHNGVYALEMSRGWFASKGIKPGMRVRGLPPAP
ncbi:hypothetical protein DFQ30_004007, partial [Apophysomyces sp. BC1015]